MTVFEKIKYLTKKRSKTMKQVTSELGYSENYFYSLKSGKQPSGKRLKEMADYFNVSVDFLLKDDKEYDNESAKGYEVEEKQSMYRTKKELSIEEALDSVMSYDGKEITDNDRAVLKSIIEGYLKTK